MLPIVVAAVTACAGALAPATAAPSPIPWEGPEGAVCVSGENPPTDLAGFTRDAVAVLRDVGYDPADYRLEIRRDDPRTGRPAAVGTRPVVSVVFLPSRPGQLHVVRVNTAHPCALSWVWRPSSLTGWQREIIDLARRTAAASHPGWTEGEPPAVQVLETRERVGIRVDEFHLLIDKKDIEPTSSRRSP